jgi:D-glutamate cyclase
MPDNPDHDAVEASRRAASLEELLVSHDTRGASRLAPFVKGHLHGAARSIALTPNLKIGIATGFFIPNAVPPAAETDGPIGAAILAGALNEAGIPVVSITDANSASAYAAALRATGADEILRVVDDEAGAEHLADALIGEGVTHLILVERPGTASDGRRYSMSGLDISATNLAFEVFLEQNWTTIGIGDGGNEIGMGKLPPGVTATEIRSGELIAAASATDFLIVSTVSNWACYALLGLIGTQHEGVKQVLSKYLSAETEKRVMISAARNADIVDGIHLSPSLSVDGFELSVSASIIGQIRKILEIR